MVFDFKGILNKKKNDVTTKFIKSNRYLKYIIIKTYPVLAKLVQKVVIVVITAASFEVAGRIE